MLKFFLAISASLLISLSNSTHLIASENIHASNQTQTRHQQVSIDGLLDRAEATIDVNHDELASLLILIARQPVPLDILQRHRLMLLQANRLILETEFEQANDILSELMKLRPNTSTMIRAIYFRAHIAEILEDYELAFLFLNRLEQYPKPSFSVSQQFEILSLATDLYSKAHAFNHASVFAKRAVSLAKQSKSARLLCYAYRAQSDVYVASSDIELARTAALAAIDACDRAKEDIALAASYINLSYWEREQNNYSVQRSLIEKAIALYQKHNFVVSMNSANLLLAEVYLFDNDIINADELLSKVFNDVEQLQVIEDLVLGYRVKAMLFEKLGLPDDAMHYFKKYLTVQNSNNERIRKIHVAYLQSRFNNKIDQQSDVISQIEHRNLDLLAKASMLTNLIIISTSLLFLSVSFYCFTFYRRRQSVQMTERSNIDALTQLYNSEYGFSLANKMLSKCGDKQGTFGVICIDLDFMSAVNNSFSHDFGDILLQAFAHKIKTLVGDSGIVVRHSGDFFIAFIPAVESDELTDIVIKSHLCLDGLTIDRQKIIVSCSIGWSCQQILSTENSNEYLSLLIEQGSQALRQAKFNGRDQWVKYESGKIDESLAEDDFRHSSYKSN